jgi:LPS-assembly lipoprotein
MWLRSVCTVIAVLVLTGCGFTPLYSKNVQGNATVVAEATQTVIDPITGRNGQILRTTLQDALNPHAVVRDPAYRLSVVLDEKEVPIGIQQDRRITRYNIVEEARYTLITIKGGKVLDKGRVRMIGSYDAVDSDFATFAAKQDTTKRVLQEMGLDLSSRIKAAFLKTER